jgi:Bax protein
MDMSKQKKTILGGAILLALLVAYIITTKEDPSLPHIESSFSNKISKLPDFSEIADVREKKKTFFDTLYPAIEQENKQVLKIRGALENLQAVPFETLNEDQIDWLSNTAEYFKIKDEELTADTLDELLERVDIIPPSLALTQAAIESGWGSSRFSRQGNNLFGQWCFSKGCGMVPSSRDAGKDHEVAQFNSVNAAIRAYIRNLNSNHAYQTLREKRARLRDAEQDITGISLAQTLINYSEEREEYITKVTKFINQNKLQRYTQQFEESVSASTDARASL